MCELWHFRRFCSGILDPMLGDSDKMLGNWQIKSSQNLEPKSGGKFPQLSTDGTSRLKYVQLTHKYLRNI